MSIMCLDRDKRFSLTMDGIAISLIARLLNLLLSLLCMELQATMFNGLDLKHKWVNSIAGSILLFLVSMEKTRGEVITMVLAKILLSS